MENISPSSSLDKSFGLKETFYSSLQTIPDSIDSTKMKNFKGVRSSFHLKKSKKLEANKKPYLEQGSSRFKNVSTCFVPSSSSAIKRTSERPKSVKLSSNSNYKEPTIFKKLNKVKLDSKGRPVEGRTIKASNASSSFLMDKMINSFRSIKLKRSSKSRSDKKTHNANKKKHVSSIN